MSDAGAGALGLSDGVSSWADVGVDAAEYSRRVPTLLFYGASLVLDDRICVADIGACSTSPVCWELALHTVRSNLTACASGGS